MTGSLLLISELQNIGFSAALFWSISTTVRVVLALLSGLLLALTFPNYNLHFLAWVAVAPLLLASLGARPRVGFLCGFVHGAAFFGITFSWIYTFLRGYGALPVGPAIAVWAALIVARSCFPGLFGLGLAYLSRPRSSPKNDLGAAKAGHRQPSTNSLTGSRWAIALLCAPFLWVATEYGVACLPDIDFIWNLLGYAVSANPGLLQMVTWTGIYGLASVIVAYNALLVWVLLKPSRRAGLVWSGATVLLLLVLLVGPRLVPSMPARYQARLVQTNLPVQVAYEENWFENHAADMQDLERLTSGDPSSQPLLVIWPEVPAPFSLEDARFKEFAQRTARESRDDFIVGVDHFQLAPDGHTWIPHNSAAQLDASGRVVLVYDKIKLVPFGEYVPLRRWLFFARRLTRDVGDFAPGSSYQVGQVAGGRYGVFICYEAIFPDEVRRFVARGAQVLINISDDGWYGHSDALAQHLAMARVRAVENRRWFLRATNTGLTAAIDPYGGIAARLPANVRETLLAPYDFRSDLTLYTRWGDWWPRLCIAVSLGLLMLSAFSRRAVTHFTPSAPSARSK